MFRHYWEERKIFEVLAFPKVVKNVPVCLNDSNSEEFGQADEVRICTQAFLNIAISSRARVRSLPTMTSLTKSLF